MVVSWLGLVVMLALIGVITGALIKRLDTVVMPKDYQLEGSDYDNSTS